MIRLKLCYRTAQDSGNHSHAINIMKGLRIVYREAEPYPIGDCWIFNDCDNLPKDLPPYLEILTGEF